MQSPTPSSLFDTPEDKAANHAYAVLAAGGIGETKLSYDQLKLLRILVECRGLSKAKPIGLLAELVKSNPRQLKSDVHDLREIFRVRIGSSRDGEGGGFYLIRTAEEAIETARPLWSQALAMMNVVRAILEPHELQALERSQRSEA